ncbi:MAG: choice-of-anchor I family protein [Candidatus Pristimantibacillus sp.]
MKPYKKKLLTVFLAAEMTMSGLMGVGSAMASTTPLSGTPYNSNSQYDVTVPHVIINQIYGGGMAADTTSIHSHGFIELYNPTNEDIDLSSWSLQYADRGSKAITGATLPWQKLDLTGTIKAHSSYLIRGAATTAASPVVNLTNKVDQSWSNQFIINKGLKVALMSNQVLLTEANPFDTKPEGYVDLVGTGSNDDGSDIDGYETNFPSGDSEGTSKKKSIRRVDFVDTDQNKIDFKQIDYGAVSAEQLAAASPQSSADGVWGEVVTVPSLSIATTTLADAYAGIPYSAEVKASGGTPPYTYSAVGLPAGLTIDSAGAITGTPTEANVAAASVTITVTDSASTPVSLDKQFSLIVKNAAVTIEDTLNITKIGEYSVGTNNKDGGVAEIVKFNKDNGKFYLVNGSGNPPSLDIVGLGSGSGNLIKEKTILIQPLAETGEFHYGDLTSVDVNTVSKVVSVSVQEADPMKNGKILVLDYDGNLVEEYEAGVQPDMIKSTADGSYILTANEGEPRTGAGDPQGSITIVDTSRKAVTQLLFDNPAVIEDGVHIRGTSDPVTGLITGSGTKADAIHDLEPEYITLSEDNKTAYVSLQENNAIAVIDIANYEVTAVKALGLKNYNDQSNSLDLVKDGAIKLENVPFYGLYMPDGIASHSINGQTYLFTANEGDVTEWPVEGDTSGWAGRKNGTTIGALKTNLAPDSAAAIFLNSTTDYDGVEVASDMGNDGIYMYGGRSFSIWNSTTMEQVYDSGNAFETITALRAPDYFNTSNSKIAIDDRSGKKGPEPEDIKTGKVGNKVLAFIGLERIGGIMTYDVTNPAQPVFANYTNTRVFKNSENKVNLDTDTAPEGLEFIPASDSPTGSPLLLVAFEVGGKVGVYQLNVTKLSLDQANLSLKAGQTSVKLTASVIPAGNSGSTVTWSSSNPAVAEVDSSGNVTPLAPGKAAISAVSEDGYGVAESIVTVSSADTGNGNGTGPSVTPNPVTPKPEYVINIVNNENVTNVITEIPTAIDSSGKATATMTSAQLTAALAALEKASGGKETKLEITMAAAGSSSTQGIVRFEKETFAQFAASGVNLLTIHTDAGTVTFDSKAISAIAASAGKGEVSLNVSRSSSAIIAAIGNRPVVDFTLTAAGTIISSFGGGSARVSIPYVLQANEEDQAVVAYFISGSDEPVIITNSSFDKLSSTLQFTTTHFSKYGVGYNKKIYNDINASFAKDSITYLSARELLGGVGNNKFAPKANMTRADFTLILARIAGVQLDSYMTTSFKDVKATDYYVKSVEWALENGIVAGIGDSKFDPKASITREQMAAMIVRFTEFMKVTLPVKIQSAAFVDSSAIQDYASEAVAAVQQAGIINGKTIANHTGNYFAPQDHATREETAKMLGNLMQIISN